MARNLEHIFDRPPQAGAQWQEDLYRVTKVPYKKDDLWVLEKLLRASAKPARGGWNPSALYAKGGFGGSGVEFENNRDQRVMFKTTHSYSKIAHEKYLKTYMPQENKAQVEEKPVLFGTPEDEYEANMDDFHHKCIISPENQDVNIEVLSREFIKRLEMLTGFKLYWRGAIHSDTAHRHAHLCINGRDKNGKKVYFQPEMTRTTMRETLSYVATQLVGERTDTEIEAARLNMVLARRWTKLDETLESYGGKISRRDLPTELASRLAFLAELGLSEKHGRFYTLKGDWKDVLLATGRYNTFLDEWQKAGGNLELYAGGEVSGSCERVITFDKAEAWNDAVIVKDGERRVYVPVWQLNKENLVGKKIAVSGGTRSLSRQVRSSDIRVLDGGKKRRKLRRDAKHGE